MRYEISSILAIVATLVWIAFTLYGVFVKESPMGIFMAVFISPFWIWCAVEGGLDGIFGFENEDE